MGTEFEPVIKRALISVSDKKNIVSFCRFLFIKGVEILSTGGTAKVLRESGLEVVDVAKYTGFPECLDGRVKTLHPMIHGGLLYLRENSNHVNIITELGIKPIDLVVVNLYPFEQTIAKPGVTYSEAIEQIDIGGPSMLRSAAKNHASVTVITDPSDYAETEGRMREGKGAMTLSFRSYLAQKAFTRTCDYDRAIAVYLSTHQPG